jgi:hypothetical protein
MSPPCSGSNNEPRKKAVWKQAVRRATDFPKFRIILEIGGKKEHSKSVPVGSLVDQNEPMISIGSYIQRSEPIGDKNRITRLALKWANCAGAGRQKAEAVRVVGREPRNTGEQQCACVTGESRGRDRGGQPGQQDGGSGLISVHRRAVCTDLRGPGENPVTEACNKEYARNTNQIHRQGLNFSL